jgi:hypothetical protein
MRFYIWEHHGYDLDFEPYRRQELQLPTMHCDSMRAICSQSAPERLRYS